jgi:phosphoglycerate dehydrogenase-like enzyme
MQSQVPVRWNTDKLMGTSTVLVIASDAPCLDLLRNVSGPTTFVISNELSVLQEAAPRADAALVIGGSTLLAAIFPFATRLRWVHAFGAGVEKVLFPELIASSVVVTNARGVFSKALAEFVMAAVLFFAKGLRHLIRFQEAGAWQPFDVGDVHGKVMGIIGYGETGRASAELAHAFGMKVLGLRRQPERSRGDPLLDRIFGRASLREMLPLCDFVVLTAPHTPETRGLIGREEIELMKPDAVLINVGRGSLVKETALVQALREKRIRGAALDVFEIEPLPSGHPFYGMENVLLSPHSADHTPDVQISALNCFLSNLARFQNGDSLENIVDKSAGY